MAPELFMAIRTAHIACAFASGSLFAVRGAASLRGASWPQATLARRGAMLIDSLLLALGVVLVIATRQYPFAANWLTAKLVLIVVYVVLGIFALKRGRTPTVRLVCFGLAAMTFLMILSVAVTHNAAGIFAAFRR